MSRCVPPTHFTLGFAAQAGGFLKSASAFAQPRIRVASRCALRVLLLSTLFYMAVNRTLAAGLEPLATGQQWLIHRGTATVTSGIGQVGNGLFLASVDGGMVEGNAEFKVVTPSNEFWLVVRFTNESNYWRFGRWQGGSYLLQQVKDGAL